MHQSYTEDEGAVLLVLWGGCHANVTKSRMPRNAVQSGFRPVKLMGAEEPADEVKAGRDEQSQSEEVDSDDGLASARVALMRHRSTVLPMASEESISSAAPELRAYDEVSFTGIMPSKEPSLMEGPETFTLPLGAIHSVSLGAFESVEIELHKEGMCTCVAKDVMYLTT